MNKVFDLIVFDWDGTLMDSTAHITQAIQQACAELALPVPEAAQARHTIGLRIDKALQQACPSVSEAQMAPLTEAFFRHYHRLQEHTVLFAGVRECLAAIQSSQTLLAVATGNSRRGLDRLLLDTQLTQHFDATRTVDECPSKPHPAMLLELVNELGVTPQRTLMIGDTSHDLQMASNAQCQSVGVSYGAHSREHLEGYQPLAVLHDVAQLQQWLLPKLAVRV